MKKLIIFFGIAGLVVSVLLALDHSSARIIAIGGMVWFLIVFWVFICGSIMYFKKDFFRRQIQKIRLPWQITFVLFCTALILIEEAITTTATNLAPFFGSKIGEAYITASTNYFQVIFYHSVVVIAPMFIVWAWLLSKYDFKPSQAFILFGLTGLTAEVLFGGLLTLIQIGFWIFVYGLMIYLPVYCLPTRPNLKIPKFRHYILAIFLPFILAFPFAGIAKHIHPAPLDF